ncbi:hypothetical protein [Flexithrix dorotheae]|uniref:hypothetical protein n=1 Tax=Flexithrix dorotheae TaxID=70993 RepID=UPI00037E6DE0|nr:hypothetical protein [Flexithrix dorotheae]
MKNNFKQIYLFLFFSIVTVANALAHALYIDTEVSGKIGTEHQVKIYYSEFEDRKNEQISDWYSDVPEFALWLVSPNGKRTQLKTKANVDHFTAKFKPKKEGIYRLEINHTAKDPGEGTAYQFNAYAQVLIGKHTSTPVVSKTNGLALIEEASSMEHQTNKIFKTYLNGNIKGNVKVTLFLPSGEKQELKSDSNGELKINFDETGTYFIEATTYNKDEAGKTKTTAYKSMWRCATQKLNI